MSASAANLLPAVDDENDENDDATHILKGGALADAFGALVGSSQSGAPSTVVGMPADEWFVGINDVPVGPIRLGEIRKRAMLGAISGDSMVWRDGLEAWRPLKSFPELLAVLEESVSSVRASAAPFAVPAKGSTVPEAKRGSSSFDTGTVGIGTGPGVVTDELALATAVPARTPMFVWLAMLVALGFGVTIGFVVWSKQKPPETIVKYVEVPAKEAATAAAVSAVDPQAQGETAGVASGGAAKVRAPGSKISKAGADADKPAAGASTGLAGLKGLSGLGPSGPGGPGSGPGSSAPTSAGGQLDAAQTQSTVARYTGSVKRSCWQPALDARDPSAPTSARVMVTITVGPSGSVQNVSTNGDPRGYPGLAPCIAGRVRAWQFPATGGTTTVNVPFVFAAQ